MSAPTSGYANSDEKTWALIAHFGGILGFIGPLVALLAKGNESPTVRAHAVEALNFQITWNIVFVASLILMTCTLGLLFFIPPLVWIVILVFSIIGGVQANDGRLYKYPLKYSFVK